MTSWLARTKALPARAEAFAWARATSLAWVLALVLALTFAPEAQAQTSPSMAALSLESAWRAALANDPTLRAARAAALSGQEQVPQARSQLLPQVSLSLGAAENKLDTTTPDPSGAPFERKQRYSSNTASISVRQPLFQFAQRATLRLAEAQVAETDAVLVQARQELASRLAQAYFELLLADDQIALVRAQTSAHTTQFDAAKKSLAAGSGVRTDIDEAQARLDLDAAQALEGQQQRTLSRRRLQQLVGQAFAEIRPLDVQLLHRNPPQPGEFGGWLALAEQQSPELWAVRARSDAARAAVDRARARHMPTLDVVGQAGRGTSDDVNRIYGRTNSFSLGLQLTLPLYSGGAIDSGVRQALAEQTRADEALAALRLDLELRLYREHRGVTEGLLRIKALEQAVGSSEQAVQSSRRSYLAGIRTTLDVLNAEQQLATTQRDLSQARYAVLLSFVRLQSLAGVFDDTRLAQLDGWLSVSLPTASP
ncbi:MAG: TolC family outer membrane protein [Burkholderiales bacterium]